MKVLVAHEWSPGSGLREELVWIPPGCDAGFVGLSTQRVWVEAHVVDHEAIDAADWSVMVADALSQGGWLPDPGWSSTNQSIHDDTLAATDRWIDELIARPNDLAA